MDAVGIDVGGTFTDFVWVEEGLLRALKVSTSTPQEEAVLAGLKRLGKDPERIVHGTTLATNALLEGRWARTALLVTAGFRDILAIGRQNRPSLYDLFCERSKPLVPREMCFPVPERLDHQGRVLHPLDEKAVRRIAKQLKGKAEATAIVFLFSFLDPSHERRAREILEQELSVPTVISSEVLPEIREYERAVTTVLSAALRPLVEGYILKLEQGLREFGFSVPLLLIQSNGGVADPAAAAANPASLIFSGPAGGVVGARFVSSAAGFSNLITLDMGGTSTDVAVIVDGEIALTAEREVAGWSVRLPSVDVQSVGAGGGSVAWYDPAGLLQVGPRSAGAQPGPACYGRGGTDPTVTDAHLILGHLPAKRPLASGILLRLDLAQSAVASLAARLGRPLEEVAAGTVQVAEATMERTVRRMTVERGHDPRDFVLVAFGGTGPLHGATLAQNLGIKRVLIPPHAGVLSALGLLAADLKHTYVRSLLAPLSELEPARINSVLQEFLTEAQQVLTRENVPDGFREYEFAADLRYQGQGFELTVPLPRFPVAAEDRAALAYAFHEAHLRRYSFSAPEEPVELVALRLTAIGKTKKPELQELPQGHELGAALLEKRRVYLHDEGWRECPVYIRELLPAEAEISGPAVIEGMESTTFVPRRVRAFVHHLGHLILEV